MFLLMIAGTAAGLTSPYALKIVLDEAIPHKDMKSLVFVLALLILTYVARLVMGYFSDYLTTWIGNKVINDIKVRLFVNLLHLPYLYFEENKPGDIIQKVNIEIHKVQNFLTSSLIRLCNNLFTIAGLSVMLWLLDKTLFLISLGIFPLAILINRSFSQKIKKLIGLSASKEGDVYNFFIDRLKNIKLIKGLNGAAREVDSIRLRYDGLFDLYQKTSAYSSMSRNISTFLVVLAPVIVLAYGGWQSINGWITIGSLVAFIQYLNRLYAPASDMIFLYTDYVQFKVSMNRIFPILNSPPGLLSSDQTIDSKQSLPFGVHSISLTGIYFGYGGHCVLQDLGMRFTKGKSYAIVGSSGSGKSSIIKLLSRFYKPEKGQFLINEHIPIDHLDPAEWNDHITIIHQEPLFFMESIRFNLTYGFPYANDEEIWSALEAADCLPFVSLLPASLDTVLGEGEGCVLLSGGQQQQLSIARAFLRNSDILILDESTSAIDSYKEKRIFQRLQERFQDKIIISVSHRLSSIRNCDEIFVLRDGQIVESGTHDQLISLEGAYYNQFESQLVDAERTYSNKIIS